MFKPTLVAPMVDTVDITPCVHIAAPWLAGGITIRDVQHVDGQPFFKVAKCDHRIQRLVTGKGNGEARHLTHTTIIEDLIELRNSSRSELLKSYANEAEGAKDELELDDDGADKRNFAHMLPECVVVLAPARGDAAACSMKVLLMQPNRPLWLELSSTSIHYLYQAVSGQAPVEQASKKARLQSKSWDKARRAFRVKYIDESGKKRQKDFRPDADSEVALAAARQAADDFAVDLHGD